MNYLDELGRMFVDVRMIFEHPEDVCTCRMFIGQTFGIGEAGGSFSNASGCADEGEYQGDFPYRGDLSYKGDISHQADARYQVDILYPDIMLEDDDDEGLILVPSGAKAPTSYMLVT